MVGTQAGWLPQLPAHWEVMRAKYVFREVDCRSIDGAETHLSMHQKLGLVPSASTGEKRLVSESYAGGKLVEPDDLVLNRLKAHLGVFAHAAQPGVISPDYTVLRPLPIAAIRYYEYLLKCPACRGELRTRVKGIVEGFWRLYTDDFYDIRLPVPPLDEQRLIVRFLDWHGAMTAKLIRAKRRLIALLNEQKQSIIHRAVTRGLDPAAKLKPSGVDWLGDVPEHWEVKPLKWWSGINRETLGQNTSDDFAFDYVDISSVGTGMLTASPERMTFKTSPSRARRVVRLGDTLVSTVRTYLKAIWYVDQDRSDLIASTGFAVLTPHRQVSPKFFAFALQSAAFISLVISRSDGVAYPAINETRFGSLKLAMPPNLQEQDEIIAYLDEATAAYDQAIASAQTEIALIQEFRTRLIADVATGQLDVRAVAESLPEAAEPEGAADLADDDDLGEDEDELAPDFADEEAA
ncbi:MAG: restriction endonuclease subunit S [Sphingomonas sp.]